MSKRLLIVQFREGYVKINEQLAFKHRFKDHTDNITFINALESDTVYPDPASFDGVILAGSGDNSLNDSNEWSESLETFVRTTIQSSTPLLGICFGHQIIAHVLGAHVRRIAEQKELGTVPISLSDNGTIDPLFKGIDKDFFSIAGHNDSVTDLPEKCVLLASSDRCPIQAFKVKDKKIYGVQFHPELDEKDFRARVEYYRDHYIEAGSDFNKILESARTATTDHRILQNFYTIAS